MSGFGLGARCAAPSCPVWSVVLPVGLEDLKRNFLHGGAIEETFASPKSTPRLSGDADRLSTAEGISVSRDATAAEGERLQTSGVRGADASLR